MMSAGAGYGPARQAGGENCSGMCHERAPCQHGDDLRAGPRGERMWGEGHRHYSQQGHGKQAADPERQEFKPVTGIVEEEASGTVNG